MVVDEAHCVSLWGKTFRPSYLELGSILKSLGASRITALTATASSTIVQDIRDQIFPGREPELLSANPDRPNIFYRVQPYLSFRLTFLQLVKEEPKPLVVFCRNRERVRALAQMLWHEGHAVQFYHAGMTQSEKKGVEDWFFHSSEGVLVSTNAYGMGVDKKNIRTVIHTEPAPSAEDYLQESGRAGRDGLPAMAVLMESSMAATPTNQDCRRKKLLEVLDFAMEDCSGCDVCRGLRTLPNEVGRACSVLKMYQGQLTAGEIQILLRGQGNSEGLENFKGWGLWKDYDDLTFHELWEGLNKGGWIDFHPRGWWKGLLKTVNLW